MPETAESSVLADATRYLLESILLTRDTDLSAATPCPGWDLRCLLRHINTSLEQFTDMLGVPAFNADADSGRPAETDPVAVLRTGIVELLLAATSLPTTGRWCDVWDRNLPANIVVYVAAIEMALHAWDIAQACNADHPIPADLASALLRLAPPLAEAGVAQHVFAEPVQVSNTATPSDQLLALFGRHTTFQQEKFIDSFFRAD
jgi:uncharacterized protein (TIGR03086 family)